MQSNNMPPPSGNPLDLPDIPQPRRIDPNAPPDDDIPVDDHDAVQKGMPNRNLKTAAILILGGVVAGSMFWPKSNVESSKVNKPEKVSSVADELDRARPAMIPELEAVANQAPPPPPIVKSVEEPKKNNDDEKMALAIASPMSADVDLRNGGGKGKDQGRNTGEPPAFDEGKLVEDAMARQQKMLAAMAAGQEKKNELGLHDGFLKESKGIESPIGMVGARKPNTIYQGTLIRTVLTRALHTDLPGTVTAKVMSDVYDSVTMRTLLIPRGSEVNCRYQSELLVGQEVVLAACERLRLPNGKSFSLMSTPASDMQGRSGLPADVDNHFMKMFGTSLMLGAASLLLPKKDQGITVNTTASGGTQTGGSILGTALHDTIKTILQRNANIRPTGTVDIGSPFTLTISRDVEMEPYMGR